MVATIVAHANTAPLPPSPYFETPIPADLDELILAGLSKNPADRPQTCEQLARQLEQIRLDAPWTAERAADWWSVHLA